MNSFSQEYKLTSINTENYIGIHVYIKYLYNYVTFRHK